MNTIEYRTRTYIQEIKKSLRIPGAWVVGLDVGYSSVKTVSTNIYNSFPAYAVKQEGKEILAPVSGPDDSIVYRDDEGTWIVGAVAQNGIRTGDTTAGSLAIYGRDRYFDPMFLVLARVGIAAGMRKALGDYDLPMMIPYDGTPLYITTGLPPMYMDTDKAYLTEVLAGMQGEGMKHSFDVKFNGESKFTHYEFTITSDCLNIIDQPLGTMYSLMVGADYQSFEKDANHSYASKDIPRSNILIVDPGFGTLDVEAIRMGRVQSTLSQTFDNLAMKRVFIDTTAEIKEKYNAEIPVPAFQKYLEQGYVQERVNRSTFIPHKFDDILVSHSSDICQQALDKIISIYNPGEDYNFFVLTGGTGAAWMNEIRKHPIFQAYNDYHVGLRLLPGNAGDPNLPYFIQNARGYYLYTIYNMNKLIKSNVA